jgi:hypothetical protein
LKNQIAAFQADFNKRTELIYEALGVKQDVWTDIEIKNVPDGATDYLLLLFKSNKGRISGKVRIKGSQSVSSFSTTANDTIPVAVPNLWIPALKQYQVPTILEFSVTEKTATDAGLSIFTQGWVDSRGTEPH